MSDGTFSAAWLENHRVSLDTPVTETSVVGIGHVLDEVRALVGQLRNPDFAVAIGADLPRGILLHGSPGTGKTLVARLLASSLGPDVPMYELSADELTPALVRKLFAHLASAHERCVLYIDEIDLVGQHRLIASDEARQILVALLAALDGMQSAGGIVLIASSNQHPVMLDGALMRPGRLGVHIPFDLPDEEERADLFRHFLAMRPQANDVDLRHLAGQSAGLTPAEIKGVVNDATGLALGDGRTVTAQADLRKALRRGGVVLPEELAEPRRDLLERTAVHEAGHIAVAVALGGPEWVGSVRIREHGGETHLAHEGGWSQDFVPAAELRNAIIVGYGGIAAEEEMFGSASISATSDVERATTIACQLARVGQLDGAGAMDYAEIRAFTGLAPNDIATSVIASVLASARRTAAEIVHECHMEIHALADSLAACDGVLSGDALLEAIVASGLAPAYDEDDEDDGDDDEPVDDIDGSAPPRSLAAVG